LNKTGPPSVPVARAYYPARGASPMPTSWKIMMALLVVCLLASMVIALVKLI
jgi:hypothetical protein